MKVTVVAETRDWTHFRVAVGRGSPEAFEDYPTMDDGAFVVGVGTTERSAVESAIFDLEETIGYLRLRLGGSNG